MIENLTVRDFALIDNLSIEFLPGFNVLTGETGAGKSILIGSLNFLLGEKARTEHIRTGAEEARVSGEIYIDPKMSLARQWLKTKGIALESDRVLLRRTLKQNGRSRMWIQDTPVTRTELSEFTSYLVDIHGQHEHQSLLKIESHRKFLDLFAGITDQVTQFSNLYLKLANLRRSRDEIDTSEKERNQKKELLSFAIEEITKASLSVKEEEDLEIEEQKLLQFEKLSEYLNYANETLSVQDGVVYSLKKIKNTLEAASSIDSSLLVLFTRLDNSFYELEDIADSLRMYKDDLFFDPQRLEQVQERLSFLYRLKKKYGNSIQEVLDYAEDAQRQLEQLEDWESNKETIGKQILELEKKLYDLGMNISKKRKENAQALQISVEEILSELGMPESRFVVLVQDLAQTEKVRNASPYGFDSIEFLISANVGESVKPLTRIASGGEISRVMLALKTVLADIDEIDTLIFDEIDAGIGGEVALAVGAHLRQLSKNKQVLCITHLASIAAQAQHQIKIEKIVQKNTTLTKAYKVSGADRIEEVARMLAGDEFSKASLEHAEELLKRSRIF